MTKMMKPLPISIALATGALALGYALGGLWAWTPLIMALGGLWLLWQRRGWGWMASVGLVFFVGAAAGGLWRTRHPPGLAAGWMLVGTVAALTAWDLDHFLQRLRSVGWVETPTGQRRELERRHLRRLLLVEGLGLLLAAIALGVNRMPGIRVEFSFGAAFSLGLLTVLGLSQAVGFLRRESD